MNQHALNITLNIQQPVCSVERFVKQTGIPEGTVRAYIQKGRIPIMEKAGRNEKIMINMVAYFAKCAEEAHKSPAEGAHHG